MTHKNISFVFAHISKYLAEAKEIFCFQKGIIHGMIKDKVLYQMVLNIVEQMIN